MTSEIEQLEQRILATTDPVERRRLLRELAELTKKETRVTSTVYAPGTPLLRAIDDAVKVEFGRG